MTHQEKLIFRFLLTVMVIGLVVSYVRNTWFSEPQVDIKGTEVFAKKVTDVAKKNRTRYLAALNSETKETADFSEMGDSSEGISEEKSGISRINLNTASINQLISLPGIGPTIAERIILHRQNYGNFKSVDDLLHVKGIGNKSMEKLQNLITIENGKDNDQVTTNRN